MRCIGIPLRYVAASDGSCQRSQAAVARDHRNPSSVVRGSCFQSGAIYLQCCELEKGRGQAGHKIKTGNDSHSRK